MKKWVRDKLICPQCLDNETLLNLTIQKEDADDVITGEMTCPQCGVQYPINEGIAVMLPPKNRTILQDQGGYNAPGMLSAYLWSHFADLLGDPLATDAYRIWSGSFQPVQGDALDVGCSVGRLSFEMSGAHQHVIGLDTSIAFIRKAREILKRKRLDFDLVIEGRVTEPKGFAFNGNWNFENVDFIVADALALPFRKQAFSTVAAINLLEKVPDPLGHLAEVNRVMDEHAAKFLFSDPFSWDESVSPPETWLGGGNNGKYSRRGIDTLRRLFAGEFGVFNPPLTIQADGTVSWKIRKTENLWEHISSQYLLGHR